MANGFRRSGDTIYRPHCESCNKCVAIRVDVERFKPSKSQKRLLNKGKDLVWEVKREIDQDWFDIYSRYITERHQNGSMYPPNHDTSPSLSNPPRSRPLTCMCMSKGV
ncbi:leucyl/phenylalanyl-tRNA-protein transferase [Vibrio sp. JCM 19236]|nr:leucyl/phenylalanyl-tRNA-protein transferase [Vibrio sp. JCM 19236]